MKTHRPSAAAACVAGDAGRPNQAVGACFPSTQWEVLMMTHRPGAAAPCVAGAAGRGRPDACAHGRRHPPDGQVLGHRIQLCLVLLLAEVEAALLQELPHDLQVHPAAPTLGLSGCPLRSAQGCALVRSWRWGIRLTAWIGISESCSTWGANVIC
jgi:hypothetical protein